MKKFAFILCLSGISLLLTSQVPQGFNYQAVTRDGSGNILAEQTLEVMLSIQSSSTGGTIFWKELHDPVTTNPFGMFTITLGTGVRQSASTVASFNMIDWKVTPKYLKTEIYYSGSWKDMGEAVQLYSVPYAMAAQNLMSTSKLDVKGTTSDMEEPLFEVKNKDGQTVFAVYNEGVRMWISDGNKGTKGGFVVSGFDQPKGNQEYFRVTSDSIRMFVNDNPAKRQRGGFAVGGYNQTNGMVQNYFDVSADSVRIYIDSQPETKKTKGGFAVGGFDMTKEDDTEFLRVTSDSVKVTKSLLIPRMTTEERDNLPFTPGEALIIFNLTESCMQIYKNNVWSNIWCFNCAPDIIIQPVDQITCEGENAVFSVSSTGTNLAYQWQKGIFDEDGFIGSWTDLTDGGLNPTYSGSNSSSLNITNIPFEFHNSSYRCIISSPCPPEVISNEARLFVGSTSPIITTQPHDRIVDDWCSTLLSISSPGYVTYKWQQSFDGGSTWVYISDGGTNPTYSGSTKSYLSITNLPNSYNNYRFRCALSNLCGSEIFSDAAILTFPSLTISTQPADITVYKGQTSDFKVSSSSNNANYLWQESRDGGNTWSNVIEGGVNPTYYYKTESNTSTLSMIRVPLSYNNYKYRCIISHNCKSGLISNVATLAVQEAPQITDIDGNIYHTIGVGKRLWMVENLKTTRYADGTAITFVSNSAAWDALTTTSKAYCWYGDDINNKATYGALYTWAAATNGTASLSNPSGVQGACPTGWHIPSYGEYHESLDFNDNLTAGGKLKEAGTIHWMSPNIGATNETGFTALPGGYRDENGTFNNLRYEGRWWTSGSYDSSQGYYYHMNYNSTANTFSYVAKMSGASIRCVKD